MSLPPPLSSILLIPADPDVSAQQEVERATHMDAKYSVGVCCQVELHLHTSHHRPLDLIDDEHNDESCADVVYCRDQEGKRKTWGGDELYIRYEEFAVDNTKNNTKNKNDNSVENHSQDHRLLLQAVALMEDQKDGSYLLDFVETPMSPSRTNELSNANNGDDDDEENIISVFSVYLEYSNGIGSLPPPTKAEWEHGGYTHKAYHHSCHRNEVMRPRILPFCPPVPTIHLNSFKRVLAFGDSTFCQLCRQRPNLKGKYYFQSNLRAGEKVRVGLNSETVSELIELLHQEFGGMLEQADNKSSCTALMVGSCLWDILNSQDTLQGSNFDDHIEACHTYITTIRQRYPHVIVIWKLPTAVHIHWVDLDRVVEHDRATATLFGRDRIRYMSASRSKHLYELQKHLMEELEVPMLDLYQATYLSADWLYPSDGRHYRPDLNRKMLGWFYCYTTDNNNNTSDHDDDGGYGEQQQHRKYYLQAS